MNKPVGSDLNRKPVKPAEANDYEVSPGFVALLERLGCSLVISDYQSSAVMCFSSAGDGQSAQMCAPFEAAMGLAIDGDRLAVGAKNEVVVLTNLRELAPGYPKLPNFFDGYFVPRTRYLTGECAWHDMAFDAAGLIAVNTRYSCICRVSADGHAFSPIWTPPFISAIGPGDRCHLNGMALEGGQIRYATALGTTDQPRGWTTDKVTGGVLMDLPSGDIVSSGLCMPHSPRLIDGGLFVLEAGAGTVLKIDRGSGAKSEVARLPGFARGFAHHGGFLFVGLSLVRGGGFKDLPIEQSGEELICGVVAIDLTSGRVVGTLRYIGSCSEIHDVQIMAGVRRLGISGCHAEATNLAINLPNVALWLESKPVAATP